MKKEIGVTFIMFKNEKESTFMKNTFFRSAFLWLAMVVVVAGVGVFTFTSGIGGHATKAHANPPPYVPVLGNIHSTGKEYDWIGSVDIPPHADGSLSAAKSVGNTYSSNITLSATYLSAQLGYSVTETYTVTPSCHYNNTTDQPMTLGAEAVFIDWAYDIYKGGQFIGTGVATQYADEVNCVPIF